MKRIALVSLVLLLASVALSAQTPGALNIVLKQGADFSMTLAIKDAQGVAINLTGYTATAQMRRNASAVSPTASFSCTIPNGPDGSIVVALSHTVTSAMAAPDSGVWDLFLTAPGGNTLALVAGTVTVQPRVTR